MSDFPPGYSRKPVWELHKRDGRLLAGEREFRGSTFFEIRLWAGSDEVKATPKGVTMPPGAVAGLAEALRRYAAGMPPDEPESDG